MMASVYKPWRTDRKTGQRVRCRKYVIAYYDEHGRRYKKPGFTDKAASEELARKLGRDAERRQAGLPVEQHERLRRPAADALDLYAADLARKGLSDRHRTDSRRALDAVFAWCRWPCLAAVRADKLTEFLADLAARGRGPRTQNYYRDALSTFLQWCISQGWIADNPILRVKRLETAGKGRRYRRRAFTADEFRALLSVAGRRKPLYAVAGLSGLRRSELRRLRRRDCQPDADPPLWTLGADITKNGEEEKVPLLRECLPYVRALVGTKGPRERLFDDVSQPRTFRADLKRAGIARPNEDGRAVDFHSLRYFFCTLLAKRLPIQVVRTLMRHRSFKQTCDTYLELGLTDVNEEMMKLPPLFSE
jgi:integrase